MNDQPGDRPQPDTIRSLTPARRANTERKHQTCVARTPSPEGNHKGQTPDLRGPSARPEGNHKGQTQRVTLTWRHDALVQA